MQVKKTRRKNNSEVTGPATFLLTIAVGGLSKVPLQRYRPTCLLLQDFTDSPRINRRSAVLKSSSGVSSQPANTVGGDRGMPLDLPC